MRFLVISRKKMIVTLLLLAGLVAWNTAPIRWKNMLLSQVCTDFYNPVYTGELDGLYQESPLVIEFSPAYYGEYAFEIGGEGSMREFAYPPKDLAGSLRYEIYVDGTLIKSKNNCLWKKGMRHNDGNIFFTLFRFQVEEGSNKVVIKVHADAPFSYFDSRPESHIVILPDYVL